MQTNNELIPILSQRLNISERQVSATVRLLGEGATIPFISRYRKEATGGLDEVQIADIKEHHDALCELVKRKETIVAAIGQQGKLTDELSRRIAACWDAAYLEDIYLPYKPKRRTRAEIARQRGLEPLAAWLLLQQKGDTVAKAAPYVGGEVASADEALKGACDIIAEQVSEDERVRHTVRMQYERTALICSKVIKGKETEAANYADYFDFSEPLRRCSSHRLLAMRRGEAEELLRIRIVTADEADCTGRVERIYVKSGNASSRLVAGAARDACQRLIFPSIENEFAALSKQKADEEAIRVFVNNLQQLLLAAPLGPKRVLAIDPGFRTGCKVVCLSAQGDLLHHEAIFPHPPKEETRRAAETLTGLVERYGIEAMAIGNGTAGRETQQFVAQLHFSRPVEVFMVSEDGASVYSASKTAREEFPEQDVTVRGAVSIGRRLMDPLAELVKIDPQSIGVGQYQHDVNQTRLRESLDKTVEHCVNAVGVNVNTASRHLLTYVSGLGPQLARNIVAYRSENGPFRTRRQLLEVPRMGAKAYEQCAGFLRIAGGEQLLDNTAVHPESYPVVERMAAQCGCRVDELIADKKLRAGLRAEDFVTPETGLPTVRDILDELDKPGLDPRGRAEAFAFDATVRTLDDLRVGMELPGIVTNITNFGCFVDMGIKEKGLIHVSRMADRYIANPADVVHLHQPVRVRVEEIDTARRRIALRLIERT